MLRGGILSEFFGVLGYKSTQTLLVALPLLHDVMVMSTEF